MRAAAGGGIAATVHAIGDAAVRRALDLMAPLPRAAIPHRIEHFQCVHPADLDRAAAAGIVVSMQPAHLLTDIPLVERHWGEPRPGRVRVRDPASQPARRWCSAATCRWRRSTRAKVSTLRSSAGAAPTARAGGWRPEEKLAFDDAVRAYTVGAAHAGGVGASLGLARAGQGRGPGGLGIRPGRRARRRATRRGRARRASRSCGGEVVMQR